MEETEEILHTLIDRLNNGSISPRATVQKLEKVMINLGFEEKEEKKKKANQNIITFDWFWNAYGKKTDTAKCREKFHKLTEEEALLIRDNLPKYIKSTPDVQYRKNPLTYLNGKCWLDEIVEVKKEVEPLMKRSW